MQWKYAVPVIGSGDVFERPKVKPRCGLPWADACALDCEDAKTDNKSIAANIPMPTPWYGARIDRPIAFLLPTNICKLLKRWRYPIIMGGDYQALYFSL